MAEPVAEDAIVIRDDPERHHYELVVDGEVCGYVDYRLRDDRLSILHTEVDPRTEGRGFGSKLARHVLDDARARGLRVTIHCPFVRTYLERHPEYADLTRR